jgi:hypothetical protein
MDENTNCVIAKCCIDGHDNSGRRLYGILMCAANSDRVEFAGSKFSTDPIDTEMSLAESFAFLNAPRPEGYPDDMASLETKLVDHVIVTRMFQNRKNLEDPKALEHRITYFCTSALSMNAISFLELTELSPDELYMTLPELKRGGGETGPEPEADPDSQEDAKERDDARPDVVVACDLVLDPINGVAIGELSPGTTIYCKLRPDSVFYSLMESASPDFDGVVKGDVTGVKANDTGSVTLALKLSDGVTGAIRAASTVRVRTAGSSEPSAGADTKLPGLEMTLAIGGVILFLCLMALLLHFFS